MNRKKILSFSCIFLTVFSLSFHGVFGCVERTPPITEWDSSNFPDPHEDPAKCGRRGASSICDPDALLTNAQADKLDYLLQNSSTSDPCFCEDSCSGKSGIKIFIALMGRIKSNGDNVLSDLKAFTTWLKDIAWDFGSCNDDVYIAVSDYDSMVFVRTGSQAQKYINDACVMDVIQYTKPLLCKRDYYNLLHDMIMQYRNMSAASKNGSSRCTTEDSSSSSSDTMKIVLLVVFVGLPAATFIGVGLFFFCPFICGSLPCDCDCDCDPCCCCSRRVASTIHTKRYSHYSTRTGGTHTATKGSHTTTSNSTSYSGGGYSGGNSSSSTPHHMDFDFGASSSGGGGGDGGGGGGGDFC